MVFYIICGQRIYQKYFLNWFFQYFSFVYIIFNSFYPVEKRGITPYCLYVMLCAIWYRVYNFKNVKRTHGGVLLLSCSL